jgi:hypothetical protein
MGHMPYHTGCSLRTRQTGTIFSLREECVVVLGLIDVYCQPKDELECNNSKYGHGVPEAVRRDHGPRSSFGIAGPGKNSSLG